MAEFDREERAFRAAFAEHADAAPPDAIRFQPTRRHSRWWVAVAAAAAVVVGVGAFQVLGPDDARLGPAGPPGAEEPAPLAVPYRSDGVLHVGSTEIRTDLREFRYAGGTTIVGEARPEQGSRWYLVDGGELIEIVTSDAVFWPTIAPDGRSLAWVEYADGVQDVVAWDVATRRALATTEFEQKIMCCDQAGAYDVVGIDVAGRVMIGGEVPEPWVWVPTEDPVEIELDGYPSDQENWPGGLTATTGKEGETYGSVTAAGAFVPRGRVPAADGRWSPDGSAFAWGAGGGVRVHLASQDDQLGLPLDDALRWSVVGWESATEVVVAGEGSSETAVKRCDVAAIECASPSGAPSGEVEWGRDAPF